MTGAKIGRFSLRAFSFLVLGVAAVSVLVMPGAAAAETPHPGWEITSTDYPTVIAPGSKGAIYLQPLNIGAAESSGLVTVVDELPPGVTATAAGGGIGTGGGTFSVKPESVIEQQYWSCAIAPGTQANSVVTCNNNLVNLPHIAGGAGFPTGVAATLGNRQPAIGIAATVSITAEEGRAANRLRVEGGGALGAIENVDPFEIGSTPAEFGVARWDGWFSNADGTLDTTAGSVPYAFTTTFDMNSVIEKKASDATPAGSEVRTLSVDLPPGFIGNPQSAPACTRKDFDESTCPRDTIIGTIYPAFSLGSVNLPFVVFNLVPPAGQPAQFAFVIEGISVFLDPSIRTGGDYGITTRADNIAQREIISSVLTLWGVTNDPTHDRWRKGQGGGCNASELKREFDPEHPAGGGCWVGPHPTLRPFLRMPTSCGAADPFPASASGWSPEWSAFTEPLAFFTKDQEGIPTGLDGCNRLPFEPTIEAKPTSDVADAPTGLEFGLHIPQPEGVRAQEQEEEGELQTVGAEPELHEADLKNAVVTLPQGVAVNPASANGLQACSPEEVGLLSAPGQTPVQMTPGPARCPDAAKVGSVTVDTPLLDHPLEGGVYVATPQQNPFGSLLALYIAVDDEASGTVLKLPGKVEADPVTGRLTASFAENPQLPFSDFRLDFFGGAGAALRTPQTCGTYQVAGDLTPWSTPEGADARPGDSFQISQSATGGPCPTSEAQLPNAPSFSAGTVTPKAGAYSPFVLHLARADGTQELSKIATTLPEGLLAKLAGVAECPNPSIAQAEARNKIGEGALEQEHPSCPSSSEVGIVQVGAGAGPTPYYVSGHAYLAGPYKGAPLSLVIVTPAIAGPYDLGDVVVRTALNVDPLTAQVDAVSDPIPHILQGIPLDVRSIALELNRPSFVLNPTSCAAKSIAGTATALGGSTAALSVPFAVGECKALAFKPKLALSLKGSTKHAGHPALRAVLTYPKSGAYSNIARAQVNLPHSEFLDQSNLNKTCTKPVLLEGKCPASTVYGTAKAWSPLLEKPLEGDVYLVGGFGYKLPALVAELDGQIRVVLAGKVDSGPNHGIRNTFEAVPDAPVEKFELQLKGGPKYSLLENSEDLCRKPQKAIASFTSQNGLVDNAKVPLQVKCPKPEKGKKGSKSRHTKRQQK